MDESLQKCIDVHLDQMIKYMSIAQNTDLEAVTRLITKQHPFTVIYQEFIQDLRLSWEYFKNAVSKQAMKGNRSVILKAYSRSHKHFEAYNKWYDINFGQYPCNEAPYGYAFGKKEAYRIEAYELMYMVSNDTNDYLLKMVKATKPDQ